MIIAVLLFLAVVIIGAMVAFVAKQPDDFTITRAVAMSASTAAPFALVNDFHKWVAWSPWEGLDPNLKRTYEGPAEGVGTHYTWSGTGQVGEGRMTIKESRPTNLINIELDFIRPFKATNITEFMFQSRGDHTVVTWTMTGKETFFTKAFSLVCNRDKLVGGMFEQGLEKMKVVCEKSSVGK